MEGIEPGSVNKGTKSGMHSPVDLRWILISFACPGVVWDDVCNHSPQFSSAAILGYHQSMVMMQQPLCQC